MTKTARQQRIRNLLAHNQVWSQEQLQTMLRQQGADVTQATLSRDLHELGVVKGAGGYRLLDAAVPAPSAPRELERVLPEILLSAETGGNLVILRTQPAHANPLAIEIDRARLPEVLGTIAGDDTVFVATRSPGHASKLRRMVGAMAGWN